MDYLFIKDGKKGLHQFTGPSEPVRASLNDDVEKGAREMLGDAQEKEKRQQSEGGAMFVEDLGSEKKE